jgi:serine/threonine protein kinase/WD40 repeat protein
MADGIRPTLAGTAPTRPDGANDPDVSPWLIGDVILGTYEVRRVFAAGGMGLVYQVRHRGWGLDLAVKRPRPEFFRTDAHRADFEREAETWAGLGLHPHVATCHYVRRIDGVPCVFAEFAPGGSLADHLRAGPLDPAAALDAAIQTAWGLDHAHGRGLIHQDVKPANLLVTDDFAGHTNEPRTTVPEGDRAISEWEAGGPLTVKVTDFGLAAARAAMESGSAARGYGRTVLVAGAGLFTPEYAAPEQFAGTALTRRADVWALSVTLLELLTGRRPAVGPAAPDLLASVDQRGWPPGLFDLLRDGLAADPDARPRDMTEVAARLGEAYRRLTGAGYPRRQPRPAGLDLDAKNNRAVSLADLGKPAEAEELWAEVLRAERDHPEAGYNLGLARWRSGRATFEEVIAELKEMAAAFPDDARPTILAAHVHLESGDPHAAELALGASAGTEADALRETIRARMGSLPRQVWVGEHPDGANAIVWAGDRHVITTGYNGSLRVWDADTGRLIHVLTGPPNLHGVVGSRDGRLALTGSACGGVPLGELILWDLTTGQPKWRREFPSSAAMDIEVFVVPLAMDADAAVSEHDGTLQVWKGGILAAEVPNAGHTAAVGGAVVTLARRDGWKPQGEVKAASPVTPTPRDDQTVLRVWDLPNLAPVNEFAIGQNVHDLSVTTDGRFAFGRVKERLYTWNLETGEERPGPPPGATGFTVSLGGPVEHSNYFVTLRQAATDRPVSVFLPHGQAQIPAAVVGPRDRLATIAGGGAVSVWKLDRAAEPYTAPPAVCVARRSESVAAAEQTCDETLAAAREAMDRQDWVAAADLVRAARQQPGSDRRADALALWGELSGHLARGKYRRGWWADALAVPGVRDLAASRDGRRVATVRSDGLTLWDIPTGRVIGKSEFPKTCAVAMTADGVTAFTASGRMGEDLWLTALDMVAWRDLWCIPLPPLAVSITELRLSGDGRVLFSVQGDQSVRRWDSATGELLATYTGRLGGVRAVAPSEDGSWFAAVDANGAAHVVDAATGRSRRTLVRTHAKAVAVAGRLVLVGRAPHEMTPGETKAPLPPDEVLTLWDAGMGARVRSLVGPLTGADHVALSRDGGLAVAGYGEAAAVWDATGGEFLRSFPAVGDRIEAVAAVNDLRRVMAAAGDAVRLWDLDWELADHPPAPRPVPEPIVWDKHFERFRLTVREPRPGEPPDAPPREQEPVSLWASKLVLTEDGLYRGRFDGPRALLHPLAEITGVEVLRRSNRWAGALIGVALLGALLGYRELPGWWAWAAVGVGGLLLVLGMAAWRQPLLVVRTTVGMLRYEIPDTNEDAEAFAASVRLAAGV